MISGYYCNKCGQSHLGYLQTGELLGGVYQSGKFQVHTTYNPGKRTNGRFLNTGVGYYESGAQAIGNNGFVEVEIGGCMNAYYNFGFPIGGLEFSGVSAGSSSFGKAVLIYDPVHAHWFPWSGTGFTGAKCSHCEGNL